MEFWHDIGRLNLCSNQHKNLDSCLLIHPGKGDEDSGEEVLSGALEEMQENSQVFSSSRVRSSSFPARSTLHRAEGAPGGGGWKYHYLHQKH